MRIAESRRPTIALRCAIRHIADWARERATSPVWGFAYSVVCSQKPGLRNNGKPTGGESGRPSWNRCEPGYEIGAFNLNFLEETGINLLWQHKQNNRRRLRHLGI